MSAAPARLAGLDKRKGRLEIGYDADIVIWHPEKEFTIVPEIIHFKNKITPYSGMNLRGVVETTFVRGAKICDKGQFAEKASGELLTDK